MKRLILCIMLTGCASSVEMRAPASLQVRPFSLENKGYVLSGQINEVPGSEAVAVFFHGSGIHDRWETMPAEDSLDGKPAPIFKPISDELNVHGISTVVFDKRGFREKWTEQADTAAKTATFENIKSDAVHVLEYVESLNKFKSIVLVGHSEGTVVASELDFDRKADPHLKKLVLIGVLAGNLKDSLRFQFTDGMADRTFQAADANKDGKIFPDEIPPAMKAGLPIEKIDTAKKGFITRSDMMRVLKPQFDQFLIAVRSVPADTLIMNKPAQWYRELIGRQSLLERSKEYALPVSLFHGELDRNVPYGKNAKALAKMMKTNGKNVSLKSFPQYGHSLSPEKNGLPTLGPIQSDAVQSIVLDIKSGLTLKDKTNDK